MYVYVRVEICEWAPVYQCRSQSRRQGALLYRFLPYSPEPLHLTEPGYGLAARKLQVSSSPHHLQKAGVTGACHHAQLVLMASGHLDSISHACAASALTCSALSQALAYLFLICTITLLWKFFLVYKTVPTLSVFLYSSPHPSLSCVCVCRHAFLIYVRRPQANVRCLPLFLSTLYLRQGHFFTEPGIHDFG